jgi:hypothetical protein
MNTVSVYTLFWLVLLLLAMVNGIVREATFGKHLPDLQAHQLSTLTAVVLAGLAVWLFSLWDQPKSLRESLLIGAIWVLLTIAFEFIFGRFVVGHSWERLFQDYNLLAGRVWLIFLLWLFMLPYIAFRVREPVV